MTLRTAKQIQDDLDTTLKALKASNLPAVELKALLKKLRELIDEPRS